MFYPEHGTAHFHARHGAYKIKLDIGTGGVSGEFPPSALRRVMAWAAIHQHELLENWRRARLGEPLRRIAPLE